MSTELNQPAAARPLWIILAATIFLAVCVQPKVSAQSGYGSAAQVLTCSSNDGRRVYCDANTQGGVRLLRQISGSPCTQGSTWGYDASGIWVDRGCRAEFEVVPVVYRGAGTTGGTSVTCSSNDGRRAYCGANTQGGVRLLRQISGSPCTQGSTWGYDASGIWVDRGCRAEFEVVPVVYRGAGTTGGTSVTCSSNDGRRAYCGANTQGGVRLLRQLSGSPCTQGSTWGYDASGIWVDRGCRAEFEITPANYPGYGGGRGQNQVIVEGNNNVRWRAGTPTARVYVQEDNRPETLFAEGRSGVQSAPWIERGHLYNFILRGPNGAEIARTQLDTRGRGIRGRGAQPGR